MEKGIIVEKQELVFLLSGKGCRSFPAFFEPEHPGEPEQLLESLFRKKWIVNSGGFFQVQPPLASAISQMAEAERILCICPGNPRQELLFLYSGERILAVQESFRRKSALRLVCLEKEELERFLEEQVLLEEQEGWEPLPCPEEEREMLPEQIESRRDLEAYPWVRALVLVTEGQTGKELGKLAVVRKGFRDMICAKRSEESGESPAFFEGIAGFTEVYGKERFAQLLAELL